jgi:DNA (cytosine-5)-methyltransferase 1
MGFPEPFKLHPNLGECYKQIGNSVCIPLFQELAIQIREQIFSAFDHQYLSGIRSI